MLRTIVKEGRSAPPAASGERQAPAVSDGGERGFQALQVATAIKLQTELFRSRRAALEGELAIIRESVRGLEQQAKSLEQLRLGREKQVDLLREQLASFQKLNTQGFISRNQLLDMERQLAEVQSKQSEDLSNIAGVNARLAEYRVRGAQRDTYARLALRAPVAGTVVDLAFHTVGGVVKPGDRIMDIVPQGDDLIVEAQVAPQYVDRVHAGVPVDVHFDAYMNRADRPVIGGKVAVVSADALTDQRTGAPYYSMRVTVSAAELKKLGNLQLQPGMQGTVMVKTGERSLLVYLTRPLLRRFTGAMAEH